MKTKIRLKICGLRSPENAGLVLPYRPDFAGFIFYRNSPRYVGADHRWISREDPEESVRKVGVFVNEPVERIEEICRETGITMVQLHGRENAEECMRLKDKGLQVIKVFQVGDSLPIERIRDYAGSVDYFLFDADGKYLGGNGIPFDWSLLEDYALPVPFFLSGGIGPENIGKVQFLDHPALFAVDVNSRLESVPGIKDAGLLEEFMKEFEKINYD